MPVEDRAIVSEHILEIRYRALGRLLDIRGLIADWIAGHLDLSYWSITENRVDFKVTGDSDREGAFVSHRNLGYIVRSPDTRNYFPDRAMRFIREVLRIDGFEPQRILRLGFRSRFLLPFNGNFQTLVRLVNERIPLPENLIRPFDAQIEDVGPILILRRGDIRIKVQSGPMERAQSKAMLQGYVDLPEVGFFIDMDQYRVDVGPMDDRSIANLLRPLNNSAWAAADFYNQLLL